MNNAIFCKNIKIKILPDVEVVNGARLVFGKRKNRVIAGFGGKFALI